MRDAARHLVVILARGDSRRMGRPKGLCRQLGDPRTLLERILDLYQSLSWPSLVVMRHEDEELYRQALQGRSVAYLACPRGGDTARTLRQALLWRDAHAPQISYLWAHPVDLPSVDPATLRRLRQEIENHDRLALRPVQEGTPGHPVVLAVSALDVLRTEDPGDATMQAFWRQKGRPQMSLLPVLDPGVIQDCDHPAALEAAPPLKEDPA